MQVNGGKELNSLPWQVWANTQDVKLEVTPAYSSAANGVAKQKHGVSFDHVRTVLYKTGLPAYLWNYAATYIVYSKNLLPAACTGFCISAEMWYGQHMNVLHLCPFGSTA